MPFRGQYLATDVTKGLPGNKTLGPFGPLSGINGLQEGGGPGFIGGGVNSGASVYLYHQYRQFQRLRVCSSKTNCSKALTDELDSCHDCCPYQVRTHYTLRMSELGLFKPVTNNDKFFSEPHDCRVKNFAAPSLKPATFWLTFDWGPVDGFSHSASSESTHAGPFK